MNLTASTCTRCATVVLAGSPVCTGCCAPIADGLSAQPIFFAAPAQLVASQPTYAATNVFVGVPAQRIEEQSVPSVGPNPFLAAARIQHAREVVAAL
jgi:hypothetical protein